MDRIAFYASQYLDKDFEVPIKAQFRGCYTKLGRHEYEHVGYYSDKRHIASPNRRKGVLNLLHDAKEGKFDVVLISDIERMALNRDNLLKIVQRLKLSGVEVYTCIGDGQPLSQHFADEIHMDAQETQFRAEMEWESYWDKQMELADLDYPQDSSQQSTFGQAAKGEEAHMPPPNIGAASQHQAPNQDLSL